MTSAPFWASDELLSTTNDLDEIPGWFFASDRALFRWFLERQRAQDTTGNIVELGCYMGKSAVVIGEFLQPGETFTVVDLFESPASNDANAREMKNSYSALTRTAFEDNYRRFHAQLPSVFAGPSSTVLDLVAPGSCRFVHVDASHLYDHVAVDVDSARALLQDRGIVAFDDFRSVHTPGVAAAVWEAVLQKGLRPVCISESKFYGTWSDPDEVRGELFSWLSLNDLAFAEMQHVAGHQLIRCKVKATPAAKGARPGKRGVYPPPAPPAGPRRSPYKWAPPAMMRAVRSVRARFDRPSAKRGVPPKQRAPRQTLPRQGGPEQERRDAPPVVVDERWRALTKRTLEELKTCDARYRPTSFWGPGLDQLLADMKTYGLERFKSWPSAAWWFNPTYGVGFTNKTIRKTFRFTKNLHEGVSLSWLRGALSGIWEARRDFDAARLTWNQATWPMDLDGVGESLVGKPWQHYKLTEASAGWGRAYLNYLLCLSALSQEVEEPPRSFLEIGGGFGVLGEIVLSRDPQARYVDVDIPPLLTVASYYLTDLFGDRVAVYEGAVTEPGAIDPPGSAVLPSYRLGDLRGTFDVFVNSYSFQEMEPDVVEQYIEQVVALEPTFVVSLNSRAGKNKLSDGHAVGVVEPVTSDFIVDQFVRRGYEVCERYGRPLIVSAGELVVLRRR